MSNEVFIDIQNMIKNKWFKDVMNIIDLNEIRVSRLTFHQSFQNFLVTCSLKVLLN